MCLCGELSLREIAFERQKPIPVAYKGLKLDCGYRAVEIKSIDQLASIHDAQLLSYLKLGGWKIGLLINFNVQLLKRGIYRKVVGRADEVSL